MTLAIQFFDRNGATPGTNNATSIMGSLVVADSHVKTGSLTSYATNVLTFSTMTVTINPENGSPATTITKNGGTYTITGGTNTDNYVFLSTTGTYSQTPVTRGSSPPAVPSGSLCILFATIGSSAGTIIGTTNVAPTLAQLAATSVAAHAPATIPGFTWDATKTVGDQLYAIGQNLGTAGAEVVAPDFKVTGLTGATAGARLVGGTASGAPASGTWQVGDLSVDQTGGLWICTTAGSPGTWTFANETTSGTMQAAAYTVTGLSGSTASVRLVGGTASGPPASGAHVLNDLSVDQTGSLWVCVGSGTPGTWQQVGGGGLLGHLTLTASANADVSVYGTNGVVFGSLNGVAVAGCADSAGSFSGAPLTNATFPTAVVITPVTGFTSTAKPLVVLFYSTSAGVTGLAMPITYASTAGVWTQFAFSLPIAVGAGVTLSCAYLILAVKP